MKLKPYKELNTWKRHNVDVKFIHVEGKQQVKIDPQNFCGLNNLDRLKMVISFDGMDVYETNFGALGISETTYNLLERKGLFFKTVKRNLEFLSFVNVNECDKFIEWCSHFRISNHIQEVVRLKLIETYSEEVQEVQLEQPKEMKYIKMW